MSKDNNTNLEIEKNTSDQAYTFAQLLKSQPGFFGRFIIGLIFPLALIVGLIYSIKNWQLFFSFVNAYWMIGVGVVLLILVTAPWSLGTGLFGHVLLPYYTFLVSGIAGWYTFKMGHSVLKLNHQVYLKYSEGWLTLPDAALRMIKDEGLELN